MITTIAVIGVTVVIVLGIPVMASSVVNLASFPHRLLAADRRLYVYQSRWSTTATTAMAMPPISAQLSTVSATKMSHLSRTGSSSQPVRPYQTQ
jgi:hypothetical protein